MKDVIKIIVAILVVVLAWKIIKGILGLLVGIVAAGLIVYGGVKLLEGRR
jgi:high-affinity Fe2+/Pb2+ permease